MNDLEARLDEAVANLRRPAEGGALHGAQVSLDMATMAIHAPAANLVTSTTMSTAPVAMKPMVLTTRERTIRRRAVGSLSVRSSLVQCRTMPI